MFGQQQQQTGFGGGGFGTASPFQATTNQGTGLFGKSTSFNFGSSNPTPAAGGGLFGAPAATTTFGSPSAGGGLFGGATSTPSSTAGSFGMFANPAPSTTTGGLFGTTTQQPAATGMFGGAAATTLGNRPLFGGTSTATTGFGTATNTNTGLFGGNTAQAGLFGGAAGTSGAFSSGFSGTSAPVGSTVKFSATTGSDTMMKNGTSVNINTKHQCITAMKEYENKSVEELRMEDYLVNRKGPQAGSTRPGLFGGNTNTATSATTTGSTFTFGPAAAKQPMPGIEGTGFFGFGAPAAAAAPAAATGVFGQPTGVFGSTATTGFGTNTTPAFGASSFGTTPTSTGGLFGGTVAQPAQSRPLFGGTNTGIRTVFGAGAATGQTPFGFGIRPGTSGAGARRVPFGFGTADTPQAMEGFEDRGIYKLRGPAAAATPKATSSNARNTDLLGTHPSGLGGINGNILSSSFDTSLDFFESASPTGSNNTPTQTITTVADQSKRKTKTVTTMTEEFAGFSLQSANGSTPQRTKPRSQSAVNDNLSHTRSFTPIHSLQLSRPSSAARGMFDHEAASNLRSIFTDVFSSELSQLKAQVLADKTFNEFSIQALWTENVIMKEKIDELSSRVEELTSENAKLQMAVQELSADNATDDSL